MTSTATPGLARRTRLVTICAVLLLAAAWVVASMLYPPYLVPRPQAVAQNLWLFASEWGYARHTVATVAHILCSMLAALALGSVLAGAAHFFPVLGVAVHHRLSPFANSFSSVGWTILIVVWLGIGLATVLVATTAILLPFVLVNLKAGFEALEQEQMEMARAFTRNRLRQIRLVMLPLLVPYLFASARITFGVACQAVLITELFGGNSGLGYVVNIASQEVDTPLIFAVALFMVALFQLADRWMLEPVQRKLARTYAYS